MSPSNITDACKQTHKSKAINLFGQWIQAWMLFAASMEKIPICEIQNVVLWSTTREQHFLENYFMAYIIVYIIPKNVFQQLKEEPYNFYKLIILIK